MDYPAPAEGKGKSSRRFAAQKTMPRSSVFSRKQYAPDGKIISFLRRRLKPRRFRFSVPSPR
ncbi:MAG: hypothetical protein SOT34_04865, partial [Candidatus Borkfalkiaceae bacterium]|nr:hypothetical protein [Christensenellaceae bacterium]